jgi:hypothetical protein
MKVFLSLFIALFYFQTEAFEGVYQIIIKKQEQKASNRWTLADWFGTQKKMALMDQWLALNSTDSWFEMVLDYGQGSSDDKASTSNTTTEIDSKEIMGAIYIKFLGLEYQKMDYSKLIEEDSYRANLLILGSSAQSTHIRGFYGKRNYQYDSKGKYSQGLYGGAMTLYLLNFLGVEGEFTKYKKANSKSTDQTLDGQKIEYGAFLDLLFFRLYAKQAKDKLFFRGPSNPTIIKHDQEGTTIGLKIFL